MSNGARQFPETGDFAPFCANAEFGMRNSEGGIKRSVPLLFNRAEGSREELPCRVKGQRPLGSPINTRKLYEEVTN